MWLRCGKMNAVLLLLSLCALDAESKKLGASIRFCCKADEEISHFGECVPILQPNNNASTRNPELNVTSVPDGKISKRNIFEYFDVSESRRPCEYIYLWDAEKDPNDAWHLYENGSIYRAFDKAILNEDEFCFQYVSGDEAYVIKPFLCPIVAEKPILKLNLLPASTGCLILTAIVYLVVPKLSSSQFGKCFLFTLLAYVGCYATLWMDLIYVESELACQLIGYFGYFFMMALMFQLVTMIYDLWRKSCPNEEQKETPIRLQLYALCVWNAAAILTWILCLIDRANPAYLSPNIAVYSCWIDTSDYWTGMVYLYGPMTILMTCAIELLILTALNVRKYNLATKSRSQLDGSSTTSPNQLTGSLLLRLAVIVILWIFEILQFNFGNSNPDANNLYGIVDGLNSSQGVLVFIMFVLNPTVIRTIIEWVKEKWCEGGGYKQSIRSQYSHQSSVSGSKTLI